MNITRVILCIIFPPLAVIDKGCGSIVIITVLTMIGWVPGVIGALVILNRDGSIDKNFENSALITFLMSLILILIAILISYVLFR